jgi:hypothetical protein
LLFLSHNISITAAENNNNQTGKVSDTAN